jgi:hypothetical protein
MSQEAEGEPVSKGDFLEGQLDGLGVDEETANSVRAFWKAVSNHEVELLMKVFSTDNGVMMEVIRDGWHVYLEFSGSDINGSTERTEK